MLGSVATLARPRILYHPQKKHQVSFHQIEDSAPRATSTRNRIQTGKPGQPDGQTKRAHRTSSPVSAGIWVWQTPVMAEANSTVTREAGGPGPMESETSTITPATRHTCTDDSEMCASCARCGPFVSSRSRGCRVIIQLVAPKFDLISQARANTLAERRSTFAVDAKDCVSKPIDLARSIR